jgi:hypothetical protein
MANRSCNAAGKLIAPLSGRQGGTLGDVGTTCVLRAAAQCHTRIGRELPSTSPSQLTS